MAESIRVDSREGLDIRAHLASSRRAYRAHTEKGQAFSFSVFMVVFEQAVDMHPSGTRFS
jgi:hypothetical protein